jgi:hypothetical protein
MLSGDPKASPQGFRTKVIARLNYSPDMKVSRRRWRQPSSGLIVAYAAAVAAPTSLRASMALIGWPKA